MTSKNYVDQGVGMCRK